MVAPKDGDLIKIRKFIEEKMSENLEESVDRQRENILNTLSIEGVIELLEKELDLSNKELSYVNKKIKVVNETLEKLKS